MRGARKVEKVRWKVEGGNLGKRESTQGSNREEKDRKLRVD